MVVAMANAAEAGRGVDEPLICGIVPADQLLVGVVALTPILDLAMHRVPMAACGKLGDRMAPACIQEGEVHPSH